MKNLLFINFLTCSAVDFQLARNFQSSMSSENIEDIRLKRDLSGHITIKNDIMNILPSFLNYKQFDLPTIVSHGCWCSKFKHGEDHNKGARPVDLYDVFCRHWYKARKCLQLLNGPCENVNEELIEDYEIQLENGQISDDSDFHCAPNMATDSSEVAVCKYSNCKIDHAFAMTRLIGNFSMIAEQQMPCEAGEIDPQETTTTPPETETAQKIKYCQLLDYHPWAEIRILNENRKKRSSKSRLSTSFRNKFLKIGE